MANEESGGQVINIENIQNYQVGAYNTIRQDSNNDCLLHEDCCTTCESVVLHRAVSQENRNYHLELISNQNKMNLKVEELNQILKVQRKQLDEVVWEQRHTKSCLNNISKDIDDLAKGKKKNKNKDGKLKNGINRMKQYCKRKSKANAYDLEDPHSLEDEGSYDTISLHQPLHEGASQEQQSCRGESSHDQQPLSDEAIQEQQSLSEGASQDQQSLSEGANQDQQSFNVEAFQDQQSLSYEAIQDQQRKIKNKNKDGTLKNGIKRMKQYFKRKSKANAYDLEDPHSLEDEESNDTISLHQPLHEGASQEQQSCRGESSQDQQPLSDEASQDQQSLSEGANHDQQSFNVEAFQDQQSLSDEAIQDQQSLTGEGYSNLYVNGRNYDSYQRLDNHTNTDRNYENVNEATVSASESTSCLVPPIASIVQNTHQPYKIYPIQFGSDEGCLLY